jgi:hypothetical protein
MTYMESSDSYRRFTGYYPAWLDNLPDDHTLEGSAMDGILQGADPVRTALVDIPSLYDYQEFNFAGPYGDGGWLEDYTAGVRGEPVSSVTLVARGAAGQTQHRGQLPAPEHTAAVVTAGRREVRGHPHWRALPRQHVVKRTYPRSPVPTAVRRPGFRPAARRGRPPAWREG